MSADDILLDTEDRMEKAVSHLKSSLAGIRTGRANPGLVDTLRPLLVLGQIAIESLRRELISTVYGGPCAVCIPWYVERLQIPSCAGSLFYNYEC